MRSQGPGLVERQPVRGRVTRLGSAVAIQNVSHWYGAGRTRVQALDRVDLAVVAGGYVALTGPSGAGKSTLLSVIGGLESPQSGDVRVGEHDLGSLKGDQLAAYRGSTIGFVFQHFGLLDLLTARENIELAAALTSLPAGQRRTRAEELLDEVGLTGRAGHRPGELSGGERQRVAIARALVNDPGLILADEPTGNLDAMSAARVLDLLERVHVERGCTLVVVTHNDVIAQRADQRHQLDAGRLIA